MRRPSLLKIHTLATYIFLYAPILVLVILSFNAGRQATLWRGFSFKWYAALADDNRVQDAALNSLLVATVTALASTFIGTLAAVGLDRYRFRGRRATQLLLYLPVVLPEIVLGVSLLSFFSGLGVRPLNLATVVLGHVTFTVSYVAVVVKARLAGLDRTVEEAARDLGATPLDAFVRVTLPRLMPGIIAGALLVFTISLDDYVVTSLISGVGSQTFPVQVYSELKKGINPVLNAACSVLLAGTLVLSVTAHRLLSR